MKGFNCYKKLKWEYPDLESARRPVPHSEDDPIPVFTSLPDLPLSDVGAMQEFECCTGDTSASEYEGSCLTREQFSQKELNDLIQGLSPSKQASELLASRLKEENCLKLEAKITAYRTREEGILPYFSQDEELVYCSNIPRLLQMGLLKYRPAD